MDGRHRADNSNSRGGAHYDTVDAVHPALHVEQDCQPDAVPVSTARRKELMRSIASVRIVGVIAGAAAVALIGSACGTDDAGENASASSTTSSGETSAVETSASNESAPDDSSAASDVSKVARAGHVKVEGTRGVEVTLTGPIAERYSSATAAEKKILRLPLTGSHNAGTRESGVVYQQFEGGVITARNDRPGTPAYMTYGKIRDAWNVERDEQGAPTVVGTNGSAGPLGPVASDVVTRGHVQTTRFEHGSISHDTKTGNVTVTVNGKVVPTE